MRQLTRSALIAQPPERVYALVADVVSYPQFVPGCSGAEITERDAQSLVARLKVHKGPLSTTLSTRNRYRPHERIELELVEGPLKSLQGAWSFTPVGANGCRIELHLEYEFANALKAAIFEPLIEGTASAMVQAFVARAQQQRA
jgi:ribosome-associated toxin RatA of RatAB toxin-antitoxin module